MKERASGRIRKKDKDRPRSGVQSSYVYRNWYEDPEKGRIPVMLKPWEKSYRADLIDTCYYNPSVKTWTCYAIPFDIDTGKTDRKWFGSDDKLDWPRIKEYLEEHEPAIAKAITKVARSSSKRGLAFLLHISPLELIESTAKAQKSAATLQSHVISILNSHGIGADSDSVGLRRLVPNHRNREKLVYSNNPEIHHVQSFRIPVVKELLRYTNKHYAVWMPKKDNPGLLYPSIGVEVKLAKLYEKLHNAFVDSDEIESYWTQKELVEFTGINKVTIRKFLKSPPRWVETSHLSKREGWLLVFKPDTDLTIRSERLMTEPIESLKRSPHEAPKILVLPEEVQDGERNRWLTEVCLAIKHAGIHEDIAMEVMLELCSLIPGHETSRNCRQVHHIVKSIYRRYKKLFGIKGWQHLPGWLRDVLREHTNVRALPARSKPRPATENEKKLGSCEEKATFTKRGLAPLSSIDPEGVRKELDDGGKEREKPKEKISVAAVGKHSNVSYLDFLPLSPAFSGVVIQVSHAKPGWAVFKAKSATGELRRIVGRVAKSVSIRVGDTIAVAKGEWTHWETRWNDVWIHEFQAELVYPTGFNVPIGLTVLRGLGTATAEKIFDAFGFRAFAAILSGEAIQVSGVGKRLLKRWQKALSKSSSVPKLS